MAQPTNYFVDYGAGNDTTGNGSIGTPWKTIQKALDTITRDATNGDQINVKAGTAQVLAAALTLATYGTPAATAPLVLRGYTSAAGDGGMGEIDCGGATMWAAATYDYITMADLEMHSFGDNNGIALDTYIALVNCEVHKGASSPSAKKLVSLGIYCSIIGCYIHDAGAGNSYCAQLNSYAVVYGNYLLPGSLGGRYALGVSTASIIANNIIVCAHAGTGGIILDAVDRVLGNIVCNLAAGTTRGIYCPASPGTTVLNNIVQGWSGAGGDGIETAGDVLMLGYNAFYNNATAKTLGDVAYLDLANDVTLAASPFTDPSNGDFSLTSAGKTALRGLGWPTAYLGAHANTDGHVTIGAIQYGEAEAGGGVIRRVARLLGG